MEHEPDGHAKRDRAAGLTQAEPRPESACAAPGGDRSPPAGLVAGNSFAVAIFTSAFLLFAAQPMMGKFILPWFGGGPMIWTACLLFFQVALLVGYTYAWVSGRFLSIRGQCGVHVALLSLAVLALPITPKLGAWATHSVAFGTVAQVLVRSIGLPILVLSSTFPLLLRWLHARPRSGLALHPYALSNLASLSALLLYPVAIEPFTTRTGQTIVWSLAFGAFSILCGWCAFRAARESRSADKPARFSDQRQHWEGGNSDEQQHGLSLVRQDPHPPLLTHDREGEAPAEPISCLRNRRLPLWLGLAGCPTLLLSATTNQLSQDLAPIPFLWVLPLTVYLLSFVVAFSERTIYRRRTGLPILGLAILIGCGLLMAGSVLPLAVQIVSWLVVLFVCCWACHSELWLSRPTTGDQGLFYLMIASGGVLGSTLVALGAPLLFRVVLELHIGLWLCSLVCLAALFVDESSRFRPRAYPRTWLYLGFAWLGLGFLLYEEVDFRYAGSIYRARTFFGSMAVYETHDPARHIHLRSLSHNATTHGIQNCAPEQQRVPLAYYSERSGLGVAMQMLNPGKPRQIGVVGLGIGTVATYAQADDTVTFYEIDPKVGQIAASHFFYLRDCPGRVRIVYGDARLNLERQPAQNFDLLVLDAFSSDAIPLHLLTREAFATYRRHLGPDGVLAAHISSVHLDLSRPVARLAQTCGLVPVVLDHRPPDSSQESGLASSVWVLASTNWPHPLPLSPEIQLRPLPNESRAPWTDERVNLFDALR